MTESMALFVQQAARAGMPQDQVENFLRAGYVPQPAQMRFHAVARQCDRSDGPDQVGYGGARGGGKSRGIFSQLALDDCQRVPRLKALYLRKAAKQAREQFEDLRMEVLKYMPHDFNKTSGVLEFPNGSRIFIGHFRDEREVDAYLGIEYPLMVIEEATTLTSIKYQALRDSNRGGPTGWRPRIYNSTNPGGVGHTWYKNRFIVPYREGNEEFTRFIPATVYDNAFVGRDYERRLEENTGWRRRAYLLGDWDIAVGQYFVTWSHDHHVIEPFDIPEDWDVWVCMDYGFAHATVFYILALDGDGHIYVVGEHWRQRALPPVHADAVRDLFREVGIDFYRAWPWVAGTDVFARRGDTSGKTIAEQYADEGIYLQQADIDRVNGASELLKLLGDPAAIGSADAEPIPNRISVFNTCHRLIECIPAMQHNPTKGEDVLKVDLDENGMGGDDPYDALRYGIMAKSVGGKASSYASPEEVMERYDQRGWGLDDPVRGYAYQEERTNHVVA